MVTFRSASIGKVRRVTRSTRLRQASLPRHQRHEQEPIESSAACQRRVILAALRRAGDEGVTLQHLCEAANAPILETIARIAELDAEIAEVDSAISFLFDAVSGVAWVVLHRP